MYGVNLHDYVRVDLTARRIHTHAPSVPDQRQLGPPVKLNGIKLLTMFVDLVLGPEVDCRGVPIECRLRTGTELVHLRALKNDADGALEDTRDLRRLEKDRVKGPGQDEWRQSVDGKVLVDAVGREGEGFGLGVGAEDELSGVSHEYDTQSTITDVKGWV